MLNTLANHNILPHSGKNITHDITLKALTDALNFTPDLGVFLFNFALTTNPDTNATTFSLNNLGRHGILEHDASLRSYQAYHFIYSKSDQLLVVLISISILLMLSTKPSSKRPPRTGEEILSTYTNLPPLVSPAQKHLSQQIRGILSHS